MKQDGHFTFNRKMTVRKAYMLISVGFTMLALIFLTIAFMFLSKEQIQDEYLTEKTEALTRMDNELDKEVHTLVVKMQTIYTESALMKNMQSRLPSGQNLKKFYWSAGTFAKNRFSTDDRLVAVYIYDTENEIVSNYRKDVQSYPYSIYDSEIDTDLNVQPVLDYVASDENDILVTGYHNSLSGRDIVRLVMKLHAYNTARTPYGYLVCDFDAAVFTDIMSNYISAKNEILWLQATGDVSVCSAGQSAEGLSLFAELKEKIEEGQNVAPIKSYEGFYLNTSTSEEYGISAYLLTSQSLALATRDTLLRTLIIAAVIMGGLSLLVGGLLSKQLSKPIEDMRDNVIRIAGGEVDLRLKTEGWSEELEVLGTEFNVMLDELQDMVAKQYETQLLMERTEYQALQAQINPHFLYNTLNTMSGIANAQDCPMVSDLCQSLSAIFRYSIDISDTLSDIRQEMQHVRNYLYVMDVRNGFQYTYEFNIPEDVLESRIPRITLQPIVENAVTHGLRYSQNKLKKLAISAEHAGGDLIIRIEDNGVGMDAGPINEELRRNSINKIEKGKSIGILNVNARIKKAFGNAYGLTIESTVGQGTCVTIRISDQKDEENSDERV